MAISAPTGAREGKCFLDRHGLTKAGLFAGLTPKLTGKTAAAKRRQVFPVQRLVGHVYD